MDTTLAQADRDSRESVKLRTRILAVSLFLLTIASVAIDAAVSASPVIDTVAVGLWASITAAVGSVIAYRRPANPCGWLLAAAALLAEVGVLALDFAQARLAEDGDPGALVTAAAWVASWLTIPAGLLFVFLLLRFPTGRVLSRRWRVAELTLVATVLLASVSTALMPGPLQATPSLDNPLGLDELGGLLTVILNLSQALAAVGALAAVASLFFRYRRAPEIERQQLKWVAYAVGVLVVAIVFAGLVESAGALNEASFFFAILGLTALPASMGVAILRHRLFDIDLLINRTIVYALMTAGVIGFYIVIVGTLTGVIGRNVDLGASLIATAVVAVAFNPVREGLQRFVNRLTFGRRDDPYSVVSGLGHKLEQAASPAAVLPTVAEDIAASLRLPYVAVALDEGDATRVVTEHGAPHGETAEFQLSHHGEAVGALIVSPRTGTTGLDTRDTELLTDLARHIGPAAHAVRLTEALQRSRASIVRAREEERRRLRRDLHDGLGPELAGIALGVSTVSEMMRVDPEIMRAKLTKVDDQLRNAIANVRSIVAGLVPPELERLGLVGALREKAETFSTPEGFTVTVVGDAPDDIGAAAELAAYRIALEAMTNAARHSGATECTVNVSVPNDLLLEIRDDGRGIAADAPIGTGLTSMRERAEEIGGTLDVDGSPREGARVLARLPVVA